VSCVQVIGTIHIVVGDLHFAYARLSDQLADDNVYKCVVFNPHLDLRAGGSYTRLTVTPSRTHILIIVIILHVTWCRIIVPVKLYSTVSYAKKL